MPTQLSSLDWKSIFEAVHAGSTVLIPVLAALVFFFRDKLRKLVRGEVGGALKEELHKEVKETVSDMFIENTGMFKQIAKDANDELLVKINGTYVRSREQKIRDDNTKERLDRIDNKLDQIGSHFSK